MKKLATLLLLIFPACGPAIRDESASADTMSEIPLVDTITTSGTVAEYKWDIKAEDSMSNLYNAVVAYQADHAARPGLLEKIDLDTSELKQVIAHNTSKELVALRYYSRTLKKGRIQEGVPKKLNYIPWPKSVYEGEELPVQVQLQNNENQPVRGIKGFKIAVVVKGIESDFLRTDTLMITEGESMGDLMVKLGNKGIYQITCSNFEMQPAEWFVKVLPAEKKKMRYPAPARSYTVRLAGMQSPKAVLTGFEQTEKRVKANGTDQATITFFLDDPQNVIADSDSVKVLLSTNNADLNQIDFWINEKKDKRITLTASSPGVIQVTARCVSPRVEVDKPTYEVKFYSPVDRYQMKASPTVINLLERSDIAVQLLNATGVPIGTDEEMEVSFYIESKSGTGLLDPNLAKILTGKFEGRVIFLPTGTGELSLQAFVKTLPVQPPILMKIVWPLRVTIMTLVGGLIGALISHLVKKKKKLPVALVIGAVMGFVFFWIMVYIGTAELSQAIVLNHLSVVVFGIVGGWLGTDVMRLLLKLLKIEL